ncbi:MAG: hypothetical protein GYA50_01070 [Eubacteriaceae bacterium]|nr:hypothetical protein [Eubacteriaceae bacterium]
MIFIKKTTAEKLKDYFAENNYAAQDEKEAFLLADENEIKAVCSYIDKKQYIFIKKIICPSENRVFIDAVIRAMLSSKLDEGFIYALITPQNNLIEDTLIKMTQFKRVYPDYEYAEGLLFDKSDLTQNSIFVDIFNLFMNHECKKAIE